MTGGKKVEYLKNLKQAFMVKRKKALDRLIKLNDEDMFYEFENLLDLTIAVLDTSIRQAELLYKIELAEHNLNLKKNTKNQFFDLEQVEKYEKRIKN